MAAYFSYFPETYVGEGISSDEPFKYRLVKNIFRKVNAREDLSQYTTLFEAYSVVDGETPSTLAHRIFDDPFLDWTILLANDITDFYEQWPKKQNELEVYTSEKYSDIDSVHHYETVEVLYNGDVFVKEGITVNETYRVVMPDGTTLSAAQSRYPVTNWEHEYAKNELKRQILLPNRDMVEIMEAQIEDLLAYEPHAELDELNRKKTVLNNVSCLLYTSPSPRDQRGSRMPSSA